MLIAWYLGNAVYFLPFQQVNLSVMLAADSTQEEESVHTEAGGSNGAERRERASTNTNDERRNSEGERSVTSDNGSGGGGDRTENVEKEVKFGAIAEETIDYELETGNGDERDGATLDEENRGAERENAEDEQKDEEIDKSADEKEESRDDDGITSGSTNQEQMEKTEGHEGSNGEGSVQRVSEVPSLSSGTQIVTRILNDLVEQILEEKEAYEPESEGTVNVEKAVTSVTTIKGVDEEATISVDEELASAKAAEHEAASLQRQQEYEQNVVLYRNLISNRMQLKRKNIFLVKKMFEYYKRKKIEHLFREISATHVDMEEKYIKALLAFQEAHNVAEEEEIKKVKQIEALLEKKTTIDTSLATEFQNLLEKEQTTGKDLIYAQTAKPIHVKVIQKLIERQITKSKEVTKHRLKYFKLRDAVLADENLQQSLETLGDNLTLMEYEQLKMQSQSWIEKLEERDAELSRLRTKATSTIQVLAEIREKDHTLTEDIEASKVALHDINHQLVQTRERLSCQKRRRDMSRADAVRLRLEAGLLSEPKLLRDYKRSVAERDQMSHQLKELKLKFEFQKKTIRALRDAAAQSTRQEQERSRVAQGNG